MSMVEVQNLVKDFGPNRAVDHVSFKVGKGDILGFLGPNGAGKSTTMKILTGFLPATSGTARVEGFDVRENSLETRRRIGYLPESSPAYPEMTVEEFLLFIAECRNLGNRTARRQRVDEVLALCFLQSVRHQTIETLSKGYKQRVGFAQAVIHDPAVLVLDEPTDGLDPNQKHEVRKIVASMAKDKAIILSTHILEEVEALCNRIIVIAGGKLLVDETPADFRKRHRQTNALYLEAANCPGQELASRLDQEPFVRETQPEGKGCLILPRDGQIIDPEVLAVSQSEKWQLVTFHRVPARLDEVFRQLTKAEA